MTFSIGQKVVCIRNAPAGQELKFSTGKPSSKIKIGSVYTVRDIDIRAVHLHGDATVRLEEVINKTRETSAGPWEPGYPSACFRPVVDRPTDISVFTEILRTTKAPKTVEPTLAILGDQQT